jgi:hypothetical protein
MKKRPNVNAKETYRCSGGTLVELGAKLFSFFLLCWQPRQTGGE